MSSNLTAFSHNNSDTSHSKRAVELLNASVEDSTERSKESDSKNRNLTVEKLKTTLEKHRDESLIIVIQDFPDPDALSSAWAYKLIAEQYNIRSKIFYGGILSHQENIALVKLTNLPAQRHSIESLQKVDLSAYQGCVLVDSQGTNSQLYPIIEAAGVPFVGVIDHHSKQRELDAEFVDLRPQTRATATILTQYIQQWTV